FAVADPIGNKHNGTVVGEHPRSFARDHVEYNACHYLDVLTKKPGALRNGAPFMDLRRLASETDDPSSLAHDRFAVTHPRWGRMRESRLYGFVRVVPCKCVELGRL